MFNQLEIIIEKNIKWKKESFDLNFKEIVEVNQHNLYQLNAATSKLRMFIMTNGKYCTTKYHKYHNIKSAHNRNTSYILLV